MGVLKKGDIIDRRRLLVVDELQHTGGFSEIYIVRKVRAPLVHGLLKINLPHDKIDRKKATEAVYELSKGDPSERTRREATLLSVLRHPNIAQIEDCFEVNGHNGILFSSVAKPRTLREIIQTENYQNANYNDMFARVIAFERLFNGLYEALTFLTTRGSFAYNPRNQRFDFGLRKSYEAIVHGDIKPENIIVDDRGNPQLIDFGCASPEGKVKMWGSKLYAPPEVYKGKGDNDSDFWHLGLCLYEFLAGEHLIDNAPDFERKRANVVARVSSLQTIDEVVRYHQEMFQKFEKLEGKYIQAMLRMNVATTPIPPIVAAASPGSIIIETPSHTVSLPAASIKELVKEFCKYLACVAYWCCVSKARDSSGKDTEITKSPKVIFPSQLDALWKPYEGYLSYAIKSILPKHFYADPISFRS